MPTNNSFDLGDCDCTNSSCSCHNGYFGNGFFCLGLCYDTMHINRIITILIIYKLLLTDEDECEIGLHDCDINATCTNKDGSFECACNDGFLGDGKFCISNDIYHLINILHGCNIYCSIWFSIGNATINLVPCPCNSSENCFTFEDDNSTEMCGCKPGYEYQMTNQSGQMCTGIIMIIIIIIYYAYRTTYVGNFIIFFFI